MNRQGIEGVPDHLKVIAFRKPKNGDFYIVQDKDFEVRASFPYVMYVKPEQIVQPDNVYGVYDLADVKIPEGYEFVEFREPVVCEKVLSHIIKNVVTAKKEWFNDHITSEDRRRIIVKPVKKTRRVLVVEPITLNDDVDIRDVVNAFDNDVLYSAQYVIERREID